MTEESLDWLAMQYVLDELPESARTEFEKRLENDLAACEAVAGATRLRMGLKQVLADAEPAISNHRAKSTVRGVFGLTLAAAILVAVILPLLTRDQRVAKPDPVEHENVELVALWRTGMTDSDEASDELGDDSPDLTTDGPLPSWLLAGVSLEINEGVEPQPQNRKDN
jgi:hypothetical protein